MKKDKKSLSFDELCKKVKSAVVAGIFIFVLIVLAILAFAAALGEMFFLNLAKLLIFSWFLLAVHALSFVAIFPTVTAYVILYRVVLREYPGQKEYFSEEIYRFLETDKDHLIHGLDSLRLILAQQKAKQKTNIEIDIPSI